MPLIRGGQGLGDTIYLRPIAEHFLRSGESVTALTNHPDVFIGSGVRVEPFVRMHSGVVIAHYVHGKKNPKTTQWEDVCRSAGVTAPLRFDWKVQNPRRVDSLRAKADGRPIILVHGGRQPMDRHDGFGIELLPKREAFEQALAKMRDCYRVQIGHANQIYPLPCDLNLNGETTVADLLDIASICDGVVAQCSFAIPLAEALDKPLLAVWSGTAATSNEEFIRLTTPQKILSAPRDTYFFDNGTMDELRAAVRAFRNAAETVPA